jgi:hypothetical protein
MAKLLLGRMAAPLATRAAMGGIPGAIRHFYD